MRDETVVIGHDRLKLLQSLTNSAHGVPLEDHTSSRRSRAEISPSVLRLDPLGLNRGPRSRTDRSGKSRIHGGFGDTHPDLVPTPNRACTPPIDVAASRPKAGGDAQADPSAA